MSISSNFRFLESDYAQLAKVATDAENYARFDPSVALVKLRLFGETLAHVLAERTSTDTADNPSQYELIGRLGASGVLPHAIVAKLHKVRMAGNRATHGGEGTAEDADELLRTVFDLAAWFRGAYARMLPEPPVEYAVSSPPDDELAQLKSDIADIRSRMAEIVSEQGGQTPDITLELERAIAPHRMHYEHGLRSLRNDLETMRRGETTPDQGQPTNPRRQNEKDEQQQLRTGPLCTNAGCGAGMEITKAVKTVARRGVKVGDKIWRCSRFPKCNGWRLFNEAQSAAKLTTSGEASAGGTPVLPHRRRAWVEYGSRPSWEVMYLNCGGRMRALSLTDSLTVRERHSLSQVAVFIAETTRYPVEDRVPLVASVLRRILGRGLLPPVDPDVEGHILETTRLMDHTDPARHPGDLSRVLAWSAPLPQRSEISNAVRYRERFIPYLDGIQPNGSALLHEDAELPFFRDWISNQRRQNAGHWWHPHASLDALLSIDDGRARRVDFLYATPDISLGVGVDETHHHNVGEADAARDRALKRVSFDVVDVPAIEARSGKGAALDTLVEAIPERNELATNNDALLLVWGPVVANRIALGVAEALDRGWLCGANWDITINEPLGVALPALVAAVETVVAIAAVWNAPIEPHEIVLHHEGRTHLLRRDANRYLISELTADKCNGVAATAHITVEPFHGPYHTLPTVADRHIVMRSTFLPVHLIDDRAPGGIRPFVESASAIPAWALARILRGVFAKREFQPADRPEPRAQETAIRRILAGADTVVLLPTGAGKSLIYQFAGLLLPGLTLVIDPIVALIDDQVDGLMRQGIDRAVGITSADTQAGTVDEKLAQIQSGDALFAFVAPERMQQQRFRDSLRSMSVATPISLLVVDEAHCVSEWGHDFRTSYLDIGRVLRQVSVDTTGSPPPLLALTGTASRSVLKDMLIELSVDRADPGLVITPQNFDRQNLHYVVVNAEDDEAISRLIGTINALPSMFRNGRVPRASKEFLRPRGDDSACGIIFCQTVNGKHGIDGVSQALASGLHIEVPIYAGKAPKNWRMAGTSFNDIKRRNAARFKGNETTVLVATNSYGMGIDKPNIRYTVHVGIPSSIESYYQEAGRAGRDREDSVCVILHFPAGKNTLDWFHKETFVGSRRELESLTNVLDMLGPVTGKRTASIAFGAIDDQRERAIHRLKLLGLVQDYVVDWSAKRYDIKVRPVAGDDVDQALLEFVRRSQPGRVPDFERRMRHNAPTAIFERIVNRADMMIEYVYDTIVEARKRAVSEMERLATDGRSDAIIRDGILRYLELGKIAGLVEELLDREPFDFTEWISILDSLETSDDAREWRGATGRMLESDPDNPGLLLGRGLAEAAVSNGNIGLFTSSLESSLRSAAEGYSVGTADLATTIEWCARWLKRRRPEWRVLLYLIVERALPTDADTLIRSLELETSRDTLATPDELAIFFSRRIQRASNRIRQITTVFQETK